MWHISGSTGLPRAARAWEKVPRSKMPRSHQLVNYWMWLGTLKLPMKCLINRRRRKSVSAILHHNFQYISKIWYLDFFVIFTFSATFKVMEQGRYAAKVSKGYTVWRVLYVGLGRRGITELHKVWQSPNALWGYYDMYRSIIASMKHKFIQYLEEGLCLDSD